MHGGVGIGRSRVGTPGRRLAEHGIQKLRGMRAERVGGHGEAGAARYLRLRYVRVNHQHAGRPPGGGRIGSFWGQAGAFLWGVPGVLAGVKRNGRFRHRQVRMEYEQRLRRGLPGVLRMLKVNKRPFPKNLFRENHGRAAREFPQSAWLRSPYRQADLRRRAGRRSGEGVSMAYRKRTGRARWAGESRRRSRCRPRRRG